MSKTVWDAVEQEQERRRQARLLLLAGVLIVTALSVSLALAFASVLQKSDVVRELLAARPRNHELPAEIFAATAASELPAEDQRAGPWRLRGAERVLATPTVQAARDPLLPEKKYENVLDDAPHVFVPAAAVNPLGPRRVSFAIRETSDVQTYPVGVATLGRTELDGAAAEWRVRPWWRPGWIPISSDCGQPGTAVIAGHVSWYAQPGPFYDLAALQEGDEIHCQSGDGAWHTYVVTALWSARYRDVASYWLAPQRGESASILSLYTCTREITGINVIRAQLKEQLN